MREFFRLPDPVASHCTALQPPVAPPQPVAATGDDDLDAVLWLRQVVQTGDAAREDYLFHCMATIRPKTRDEAKAVLRAT